MTLNCYSEPPEGEKITTRSGEALIIKKDGTKWKCGSYGWYQVKVDMCKKINQVSETDENNEVLKMSKQEFYKPLNSGYTGQPDYIYNNIPIFSSMKTVEATTVETIKTKLRHEVLDHKFDRIERLEAVKSTLAVQRMEKKEELKERRELIAYEVSQNAEGYLVKELHKHDGTVTYVGKICAAKNLHMTVYQSFGKCKKTIFFVQWDEALKPLKLTDAQLTPDSFAIKMTNAGFPISSMREYKRNLVDLVLGFLLRKAEHIELPYSYGWNRGEDGEWIFASNVEKTWKGLKSDDK